jgi:hypothetical protein
MTDTNEDRDRKIPHWIPVEAREHLRAAREEMREGHKSLFPPEFIEHRRAARREMLFAARTIIDKAIERLE